MDDFIAYLENAFDANFVQGEYNNLHRDLYGILARAASWVLIPLA